MSILTFTIELNPVPASRPKVPRKGKPYYSQNYTLWREEADAFLHYTGERLTGPLFLALDMVCTRPRQPTHAYPSRRDVDNLAKAAMDAITNAGIWVDDDQVVELNIVKRYAAAGEQPHTYIHIEQVEL